jgi:hypothetical protein
MGGNASTLSYSRVDELRKQLDPTWAVVAPELREITVCAVQKFFSEGPPNVRRVLLSATFSQTYQVCYSLLEVAATGVQGVAAASSTTVPHASLTATATAAVNSNSNNSDVLSAAEVETMEHIAVKMAHRGLTASDVHFISKGIFKCMEDRFESVGPAWVVLLEEYAVPLVAHVVHVANDLLQSLSRGRKLEHPELQRWIRTFSPPNVTHRRFQDLCGRRAAEAHTSLSGADVRILPVRRRYFSLRQRYLYIFDIEAEGLVNEDGPNVIVDLARVRSVDKGAEDDQDSAGSLSERALASSISLTNTAGTNSNSKLYSLVASLGDSDHSHVFYFTSEISRNAWWRHLSSTSGVLSPFCSPAAPDIQQLSISSFVMDRFPFKASVPDFEFMKMLGAGTFGRVVQVRHRGSGAIFAMKIIRKERFHSIRNVVEVRRERAVLEEMNNPYIMRINATFQSESRVYFLLDYLPGGELLRHTQKAPGHHFNEDAAKFYIAELALALEYLRVRGIVHRDIKGDNLVLDEDGHLVLTDFGFAKNLSTGPKKDKTCCGTLAYIAPEMLQVHRTGYGVEVDWWSMGVVLFTVLTGYFPFLKTTRKETVNAIVNQPLQFPSKPPLTPDARDCCHKLMAKRPDQRIASLALLKAHPWFQGFNWAACEKRQLRPPFLPTTAGGGDKKDAKKTDSEYQDEYRAAVSFIQKVVPPEKDIFGAFFDAQEIAGSDRDESESESDGDEDEVAAYERLADGLEETKATFNDSNQMLRPFFSSMSVK